MSARRHLKLMAAALLMMLLLAGFIHQHRNGFIARAGQNSTGDGRTKVRPILIASGIFTIGNYQLNAAFTPDGESIQFTVSTIRCS